MKKNLPDWESNQGPSDPQPSTYALSYRAIDIFDVKIDFAADLETVLADTCFLLWNKVSILWQVWFTSLYSQAGIEEKHLETI